MSRSAGGFPRPRGGSCQFDPGLLNARGGTCKRNGILDNTSALSGSLNGPFADMSGSSCQARGAFVDRSAGSPQLLARRAVTEYTPLVESLLRGASRDVGQIEWPLDGLLGFCFDDQALDLYRRLCRHHLTVDPEATAAYVHAYRGMWDADGEVRA